LRVYIWEVYVFMEPEVHLPRSQEWATELINCTHKHTFLNVHFDIPPKTEAYIV
jgi:hypothetical protein